ncbi:MAG TPA: hypothetical protein VLA16_05235 [Ideonella sp.]|nr:hypothetical protein [Ideonella sp.]
MNHYTLSKTEWVDRFAQQMVDATDFAMSLGEAITLAQAEYDRCFDASPEATVQRLMSSYESDNDAIDATWRTIILLKKVSSRSFRRRD